MQESIEIKLSNRLAECFTESEKTMLMQPRKGIQTEYGYEKWVSSFGLLVDEVGKILDEQRNILGNNNDERKGPGGLGVR